LHHLYLADARENSLRNDYRYSEKGNHRDQVSALERRWRRIVGDTVSYFGIYYPEIFMEHMSKIMKDEEWKRWIRDDKFAKKWMIQRDMEIEKIQGNGNPFLRYPILYVVFFEEWTWENVKKRMRETIRHQKMYYKYSSNFYKSARISSKDK
jgi:endonuclease I